MCRNATYILKSAKPVAAEDIRAVLKVRPSLQAFDSVKQHLSSGHGHARELGLGRMSVWTASAAVAGWLCIAAVQHAQG